MIGGRGWILADEEQRLKVWRYGVKIQRNFDIAHPNTLTTR